MLLRSRNWFFGIARRLETELPVRRCGVGRAPHCARHGIWSFCGCSYRFSPRYENAFASNIPHLHYTLLQARLNALEGRTDHIFCSRFSRVMPRLLYTSCSQLYASSGRIYTITFSRWLGLHEKILGVRTEFHSFPAFDYGEIRNLRKSKRTISQAQFWTDPKTDNILLHNAAVSGRSGFGEGV